MQTSTKDVDHGRPHQVLEPCWSNRVCQGRSLVVHPGAEILECVDTTASVKRQSHTQSNDFIMEMFVFIGCPPGRGKQEKKSEPHTAQTHRIQNMVCSRIEPVCSQPTRYRHFSGEHENTRQAHIPDRARPPDLAVRRLLVEYPCASVTHDDVQDALLRGC